MAIKIGTIAIVGILALLLAVFQPVSAWQQGPAYELITPRLMENFKKLGLPLPQNSFEPDITIINSPESLEVPQLSVDPGHTVIYVVLDVGEEWWAFHHILNLLPTETGYYEIEIWFHVINPSDKWAYTLQEPYLLAVPWDIVNPENITMYHLPEKSRIPWDSYIMHNKLVLIGLEIVGEGYLTLKIFGNQLRTDINGDRTVDIFDVVIVALHYDEDVSTNPYVVYNIVIDRKIDLWDIVAVALELGREIPA